MKIWFGSVVKLAVVASVLTSGMALAPSAFAATKGSTSPPKQTLVALGDSITFGYNLQDTKNNSVPSSLAYPALIGTTDKFNVSNLGIPDMTSGELAAVIKQPNFTHAIEGASVITLNIGSNDLLQWASDNGLLNDATASTVPTLTFAQEAEVFAIIDAFGQNFKQIVAYIRAQTSAPIVAYNLYNPFPSQSPLSAVDEELESYENAAIQQVATASKNVVVADAYDAFNGNQWTYVRLAEEDVHPNATGQAALANIGEQALQSLQSKMKTPKKAAGVTHLLVGNIAQTGGALTGSLNGRSVKLHLPADALNQATEADLTSQAFQPKKLPKNEQFFAEYAVNFASSATLKKAYTLTITDKKIPKKAKVYQMQGNGLKQVKSITVKKGQLSITQKASGDFVILVPKAKKKG